LIKSACQEELYAYFGGIIREQKGILRRTGGADHVHLLAKLSPTIANSDVLRLLKSNSSKWICDRHGSDLRYEWQSGFAAFSVSESQLPAVIQYIDNQREHYRARTFEEEFLAMLERHGIEFDPRLVFEQEIID
jgi:putative transposase